MDSVLVDTAAGSLLDRAERLATALSRLYRDHGEIAQGVSAILDLLPDAVLVFDNRHIRACNRDTPGFWGFDAGAEIAFDGIALIREMDVRDTDTGYPLIALPSFAACPENPEPDRMQSNAGLLRRLWDIAAERRPLNLSFRHLKSGQRRFIRCALVPMATGEDQHAILTLAIDVTQARQAERAAANSETKLRMALEAGEIGVWEYDGRTKRLIWSERTKELHGLCVDSPAGSGAFLAMLHPDDRRDILARWKGLLVSPDDTPFQLEYRVSTPTGEIRWVSAFARAIYADGKLISLIGTAKEITAVKRADAEQRQLTEILERRVAEEVAKREKLQETRHAAQKMETISQFAGGIAHDFNNLLTVIAGQLEILRQKGLVAAQERSYSAIERATRRASRLTRQLMAFSRGQTLRAEYMNLGDRRDEIIEMVEPGLRGNIHLLLAIEPELWPVFIDPDELDRAILNITLNARDAMPAGGQFHITFRNIVLPKPAALLPTSMLEGISSLQGDFVLLSFSDNGEGIPPDLLGRVFEPFFTTKGLDQGTGLGLSQVYGFISQSGGKVTIDSFPGRGTTVRLYLPRAAKPASLPALPRHQKLGIGKSSLGNARVLLVEDDAEVAEITCDQLDRLGMTVSLAEAPMAALEILAQGEVMDLVVTDILMPGSMNGADLARKLKILYPWLPVILLTGYSEAARDIQREGFVVLPKPCSVDTLGAALRRALR